MSFFIKVSFHYPKVYINNTGENPFAPSGWGGGRGCLGRMQILSAYLVLPVVALPRKLSQYSLLVHGLTSLLSCVLRVPRLEDMVTTS